MRMRSRRSCAGDGQVRIYHPHGTRLVAVNLYETARNTVTSESEQIVAVHANHFDKLTPAVRAVPLFR